MFTGAIAYKHCKGRPFLANFCMILHWNSFIHPSKVYFSVNQQDRTWWWNECLKVDITGWKNLGENIFWLYKRILINRRGKVRRRLEERVFLWIYEGFLLLSQSVLSLGDESLKLISHMFFSYPLSFFFFFYLHCPRLSFRLTTKYNNWWCFDWHLSCFPIFKLFI